MDEKVKGKTGQENNRFFGQPGDMKKGLTKDKGNRRSQQKKKKSKNKF
jgi:hypothetical protein